MSGLKLIRVVSGLICTLGSCGVAMAVPISPGDTIDDVVVDGRTALYEIGTQETDGLPAVDFTFSAGDGNVFNFAATGLVNCCGDDPATPPDGRAAFGGTSVTSLGAISAVSGNRIMPLLGVFTDGSDPAGGDAPSALSAFDATAPSGLAPGLGQVFYIGDGRSGEGNIAGSILDFMAPAAANSLFLGFADSQSFGGAPSFYDDNTGSFSVDVTFQPLDDDDGPVAVTEPGTLCLFGAGLFALRVTGRRLRFE